MVDFIPEFEGEWNHQSFVGHTYPITTDRAVRHLRRSPEVGDGQIAARGRCGDGSSGNTNFQPWCRIASECPVRPWKGWVTCQI